MNNHPILSIVSPVYKAKSIIEDLVSQLKTTLDDLNIEYEIILVDDRCPENSWDVLKKVAKAHNEVKSIRLSRNFGQHQAIMAGISQSKGEWVIVMDCDLQDQPKEIKKLYNKAKEGFDVVLAKRENRQDSFLKKASSTFFYKVFNFLTGVNINNEIANYGIYNRKVIDAMLRMGDALAFFPLFVNWVGYHQTQISVEHAKRQEGRSSYSLITLFKLAFNTIISFSDKPLRLFLNFGIITSILSFLGGIYIFIKAITDKITVLGYSSIFISICFFSGIIITTLGIIGIYLGKTFNQVKNRPNYIIEHVLD
jgi:dolichol-phosphate mannosyltransferase